MAFVAGEEGEGVAGGVFVEGLGDGLAGGSGGIIFGGEGEEVAFDVVDALEFPEEGGGLGEEVELEGANGVEVLFDFVFEGLVGGGAFIGEEGGWGA